MQLSGAPLGSPFNLNEILRAGLESQPDQDALVSLQYRWTWRELDLASGRLAANYMALGLRAGDRVASLVPNRGALFVHYIACIKAGFVIVPLNYRFGPSSIDYVLSMTGASLMLAHGERRQELERCAEIRNLRLGLVGIEDCPSTGPHFEELVRGDGPIQAFSAPASEAPAAIFATSGSTGKPKGVTHSYGSLGWMFATIAAGFELTARDMLLPGSSCSHIGGFSFAFAALGVGARVAVAQRYTAGEVLSLFRLEKPTVLCMIPAALFAVVRHPQATQEDFASLRLCRSGSDKVPAELEKEFTQVTGHDIDEGYGCSESGLVTLNPPSGKIKLGSVGKALPGVKLSIRDDGGEPLPSDTDGNLWIKSSTLMTGYWGNDQASQEAFRDGWFDSGDRMAADQEGYLWFRGRKKQIIVHDGSNIYPQEVEEALHNHPAVEIAGVIGIHDLVHGENVRAYVVLKPEAALASGDELIEFVRDQIGYKAPEEIEFIAEMPLNPTGKVDRVSLKEMARERHRHE